MMNRIIVSASLFLVLGASVRIACSQPLLAVDVDRRTPGAEDTDPLHPNTVAGFQSFVMTAEPAGNQTTTTGMVGGYTITMNAVQADGTAGGFIADRDRATPTNSPAYAQLYDDFIFSGQTDSVGGSIDLIIDSGGALAANTLYIFSVYAFDTGSTGEPQPRTADWLDGNQGDALVLSTSFSGADLLVNNDDFKFTGVVSTDAIGNLLLKGRNTTPLSTTGSFQPGVFINGFEISQIPEPSTLALAIVTVLGVAAWRRRRGNC